VWKSVSECVARFSCDVSTRSRVCVRERERQRVIKYAFFGSRHVQRPASCSDLRATCSTVSFQEYYRDTPIPTLRRVLAAVDNSCLSTAVELAGKDSFLQVT